MDWDLFAYLEAWNQPFEETLRIPYSRRKRALRWKSKIQAHVKENMRDKTDKPIVLDDDETRFIWGDPSKYMY